MKVNFADAIVEVKKFTYQGTYTGHMEGTRESLSKHIIQVLEKQKEQFGKGWNVFLDYQDVERTELREYQYYMYAEKDMEHDIFITWFADALQDDSCLRTVIEQITSKINFNDHCRFCDLDNW